MLVLIAMEDVGERRGGKVEGTSWGPWGEDKDKDKGGLERGPTKYYFCISYMLGQFYLLLSPEG